MLVGFGFQGLSSLLPVLEPSTTWAYSRFAVTNWPNLTYYEVLYDLAVTYQIATYALGMSFNLVCLFISMLSIIAGQGMALRGPEGSMDVAARHMERQNKRALRKFGRGLLAFCLSFTAHAALFLASLEPIKGVILLGVGGWTIHTLLRYGIDIKTSFHISHRSIVRATWSHQPDGGSASALMDSGDSSFDGRASGSVARRSTGEGLPHEAAERGDPADFGHQLEALGHHLEGASVLCSGCLSMGLLPMRPLWRMDMLLPRAYELRPDAADERARARQREQQAVADQIRMQQCGFPEQPAAPAPGTSAGGWFNFARGVVSAKEPLLPA